MPFSYMASLVACFFQYLPEEAGHPAPRAVRLGYLQSIKRDTQPLGSPRYSCHTDLSDRQFVRPLVFDILRKSRQFPYRHHLRGSVFKPKKALLEQIYFLQQI